MMDTLAEITRNVISVLLIGSFLEIVIPPGELARVVRLLLGLILLAVIISPISQFFFSTSFDESLLDRYFEGEIEDHTDDYLSSGVEISNSLSVMAEEEYSDQLNSQIEALVLGLSGADEVNAAVVMDYETITGIEVSLHYQNRAAEDGIAQRMSRVVSGYFALDEDQVECHVVEEEVDDEAR